MLLKRLSFGNKECEFVQIFWARIANFCHLGLISDPLIVSKFHNKTHDPKGQEKIKSTL